MFSKSQPDYDQARAMNSHIEFVSGWRDDLNESIKQVERNLLIINDQIEEAGSS